MNVDHRALPVPDRVDGLLRQRFLDNAAAAGIALAAASETFAEPGVLDELATAWHRTRVAQAEAAAALCGAIAAAAEARVTETEISRRTGVPLDVVRGLGRDTA